MWNPFKRKIKVDIIRNGDAAAQLLPYGEYLLTWERQRMPDPGAQAFSWETLGLSPFNIVNSGFGQNKPWITTQIPLHVGQAVPLVGIPRIGAQIAFQPLIRGV